MHIKLQKLSIFKETSDFKILTFVLSKQLAVTSKPKTFGCYVKHQVIREQKKRILERQTHQKRDKTNTDGSLKPVELFLVNIKGLVTNAKNKCSFVKEMTTSDTHSKIILMIEFPTNV